MSTAPGQSKGPDDVPAFVEQTTDETEPKRPAKNANKQEWVDYADARGIDSSGTVADITGRIDEADKDSGSSNTSDESSTNPAQTGVHADAGNDGSTPILVPGPTAEAPIQAKQDRTVSPEAATAALNEQTAREEAEKVRDLSGDDNGDGAGTDETQDEDDESTDSAFENLPLDKLPLASQVGDLLLRVEQNKAGIVVLTVSMFGYIGDIPISIRAEQAGDLEKAVAELRRQAQAAK